MPNRYSVSVAEIDNNEQRQIATLGVSCVSNSRKYSDTIMSPIVNFIAHNYPNVELLNYELEVISVL